MFDSLTPADLGLPSKFTAFRPSQRAGLDWALYECGQRFTAVSMPTGSGKSLYALALAQALGVKAVYLTATKGLQEQVLKDAAEIGMVDVRGRANYRCSEMKSLNCEHGLREGCTLAQDTRCPAKKAVKTGEESQLVVTNYSWLLHSKGMLGTGLLICDEVHALPELLADYMAVVLPANVMDSSGLMDEPQGDKWKAWAADEYARDKARQKKIEAAYKLASLARQDADWQEIDERLQEYAKVARMDSNWVWETSKGKVYFTPIWPGRYASALWQSVPRILLISATLRPYTLALLGLGRESYDFKEWPSVFPPQRSPVYHLPTVKLSWKSSDADYEKIVEAVDGILAQRPDRRGIIHTVSYSRAKLVLSHSRYARRMVWNDTGSSSSAAVERFRSGPPDTVLVSPSFGTGHDFAGDQCEFQIILKIPFPDTSSRVMKERCKDGAYRFYTAAQTLVQMAGRAMRSADDRSETFILDSAYTWLASQGRKYFPSWWRCHPIQKIPQAPPKIISKIIVDTHASIGVK